MQSTGQTSTQALSLTSIHGAAITYAIPILLVPPFPSPGRSTSCCCADVVQASPREDTPPLTGQQACRPSNDRFGGHGRGETARPSPARLKPRLAEIRAMASSVSAHPRNDVVTENIEARQSRGTACLPRGAGE